MSSVSVESLRARTVEVDGCWEWAGGYQNHGKVPCVRVDGKSSPVRRVMWELVNGRSAGKLKVINTCENSRCICPDHTRTITASTAAHRAAGKRNQALTSAKISKTIRERHGKVPDEVVHLIRSSDAKLVDLAKEHNIHVSYAGHIRHHLRRKHDHQVGNPFWGLVK